MAKGKKKKPNQNKPGAIDAKMRNKLFKYYCETGSIRKTAREFGFAESSVHRIKKKYDWVGRLEKVTAKVQESENNQAVKALLTNLDTAKAIHKKLAAAILSAVTLEPNIGDFVKLSKYIDETEGISSTAESTNLIVNLIQNYNDATETERAELIESTVSGIFGSDKNFRNRL